TMTLTPGTTAPVVSCTTPEMAPEKPCANIRPLDNAISTKPALKSVDFPVIPLPRLTIRPPFFEMRLPSPESRSQRGFRARPRNSHGFLLSDVCANPSPHLAGRQGIHTSRRTTFFEEKCRIEAERSETPKLASTRARAVTMFVTSCPM